MKRFLGTLRSRLARTSSEVQVCLATAAGCFLVGGIGGLLHWFAPGSTNLWAISWVGAFYLVLGLVSLVSGKATTAAPPAECVVAPLKSSRRVA